MHFQVTDMSSTHTVTPQAGGDAIARVFADDGFFPNNARLPALLYRRAVDVRAHVDPAAAIERIFVENRWRPGWRDGLFGFQHYHSTAHEVLAVYAGSARIQLGGPDGECFEVAIGDVIAVPAGVAHINLGASPDFAVVGHYPDGQRQDMCYGKPGERPAADRRIAAVPLPQADPVFGGDGPVVEYWLGRAS